MTGNVFLFLSTIGLFITGGILFSLDSPYWFYSIPIFTVAILIPIVSWMWSVAGWADNTLHRWTDKNLATKEEEDEKK